MTVWIDRVLLIVAAAMLAAAALGSLSFADRSKPGGPPWRVWSKHWVLWAVIFGSDVTRSDLTQVERWGRALFSAAIVVAFAWDCGHWWLRRPAPATDDAAENPTGQGDLLPGRIDPLSSDGQGP